MAASRKTRKVKTVKFDTYREFLTANKAVVLNRINAKLWDKEFDMKTVGTAYFEYVKNSRYAETFTCQIEVTSVTKLIENSIRWFLEEYEVCFDENQTVINNWEAERKAAERGSVSW